MVNVAPLAAIVECTHGQLFLYDWSIDQPAYLDARYPAEANGISVGKNAGVIDVFLPLAEALVHVRVQTLPCPPPTNPASDHIVQFGIGLPTGQLALEGGYGDIPVTVGVQAGLYRARLSGTVVDSRIEGVSDDVETRVLVYDLEMWLHADVPEPPSEIRRFGPAAVRST